MTNKELNSAANDLAKKFGKSEGVIGNYFKITVKAKHAKNAKKAKCLQNFLNVRYNQLYHRL